MKKIAVFSSSVLLAAILTFSALSFRDDDPKKQKTETTASTECKNHKDGAACPKAENKACCKKQEAKAEGQCEKKCSETADKK